MELRGINTFIAVVQNKDFSHAAQKLGYTQAAVTLQIKNLEKELGVRLFDRLGKSVRLTLNGQTFFHYAIKIYNSVQEAVENTKESEEPEGELQIGTIDSICSTIMPALVSGYMKKYPKVRISVTTDTPSRLLAMLKSNELDMVYLVDDKVCDPAYITIYEKKEKAVFAAKTGHPLLDDNLHTLQEIQNYPVMLTEKAASYRKVLDYILAERGVELKPVFQSNNTDLLLRMMEKDSVTFLPEYVLQDLVMKKEMGIVKTDKLEPIYVFRQVLHHKDKWITREMRTFIEEMKE